MHEVNRNEALVNFQVPPRYKTKTSWKWQPLKHRNKTININSVCDTTMYAVMIDSAASSSLSTFCLEAPGDSSGGQLLEMATKALRSKRLFFQPGNTSSILDTTEFQFQDCVAPATDSENPFSDFRSSMEEMVEAYGLKYLDHLEELLTLYLRMNRKKNHGLIVDAFIDIFSASISSCSLSHCATSSSSKSK